MMSDDDNDGQMIFGEIGGLKLPDISLTGEEKPRKNLTQETCPDRGSNPGTLRDRRACCRLAHSGGLLGSSFNTYRSLKVFPLQAMKAHLRMWILGSIYHIHSHVTIVLSQCQRIHGRHFISLYTQQ